MPSIRFCLAMCCCFWASQLAARELTCYSAAFAPYVIQNGENIAGIDVDVLFEAGRRAGLDIKFALLPWVRLENEIKRGSTSAVECAFAYTQNDTRNGYMDFAQTPLKLTRYVLFVREGSFSFHGDLNVLKGKRIGLRLGFIVPGAFEEMRKRRELLIEEVSDDVSNFRKLALGRIDAIVANADAGQEVLRSYHISGVQMLEPAVVETPTYLIMNKAKNLSSLLPGLERALIQMNQDGSVSRIREKYLK